MPPPTPTPDIWQFSTCVRSCLQAADPLHLHGHHVWALSGGARGPGETPSGDAPAGDTHAGETPAGATATEEAPAGEPSAPETGVSPAPGGAGQVQVGARVEKYHRNRLIFQCWGTW